MLQSACYYHYKAIPILSPDTSYEDVPANENAPRQSLHAVLLTSYKPSYISL